MMMMTKSEITPIRDMTLTESTGMLLDAARERRAREKLAHERLRARQRQVAMHEATLREANARGEDLRNLGSIRQHVQRVQHSARRHHRRMHGVLTVVICTGALVAGVALGQVFWSSDASENAPAEPSGATP